MGCLMDPEETLVPQPLNNGCMSSTLTTLAGWVMADLQKNKKFGMSV